MGNQIRFYYSKEIEMHILNHAKNIKFNPHEVSGAPSQLALGKETPNSQEWPFFFEYIQFSRPSNSELHGRIWIDSVSESGRKKSNEFLAAYNSLCKYIKTHSKFHAGSGLWVWNDHEEKYLREYNASEKKSASEVENNIALLNSWRNEIKS